MRALPGRLLVIGDRRLACRPLVAVAAELAEAGCPWFMIREKDLAGGVLRDLVLDVAAAVRGSGMILVVNGAVELAEVEGLAGVHLTSRGDPAAARARLGPEALIGQSAHDRAELRRAAVGGADYVTLSPIFTPSSKPDRRPPLGLEGLAALAKDSPLPLVALAGIGPANAAAAVTAGAAAVAVLGGVMAAERPGEACKALLAALKDEGASAG